MRTIARPPCTRPTRTKPRARNLHKQVNYQLDAAGNLTSYGLRTFDYDSTNRHTKTTISNNGEASKITYLHNALGQRVFKSEPQTAQTLSNEAVLGSGFTNWLKRNFSWMVAKAQTNATLGDSYVYADGGSASASGGLPSYAMLGEYGNGGASSTGRTEYLYLPTDNGQAIPVGIYRGSRFYAVHADHLNTPRLINDDSNKAVWQWPYSAFGDNKPVGILKATTNPAVAYTQDSTTNARLQATNPAIIYNPRFPGQYQDTESGMFQNGFRSLMASQGRYSQFDPKGLEAGWNPFGYVEADPLGSTDPDGLNRRGSTSSAAAIREQAFPRLGTTVFPQVHGHHSGPVFMGFPRNQQLSPLLRPVHEQLHRDLNTFLRTQTNEFGQHMRPQRGNSGDTIRRNFPQEDRYNAMREFYNRYGEHFPQASRDFFRQFPDQNFCGK